MLWLFPEPYPDESFHGVMTRYHLRTKSPREATTFSDIFGNPRKTPPSFPWRLADLATRLPPGVMVTTADLIQGHTLYPYFAYALPPERASRLYDALVSTRVQASYAHVITGVQAAAVPWAETVQVCVECLEADRQVWGEPFYHRAHQLPAVLLCHRHGSRLVSTPIPLRTVRGGKTLVPAAHLTGLGGRGQTKAAAPDAGRFLLALAKDSAWVLSCPVAPGDAVLRRAYVGLLVARGLCDDRGATDTESLRRWVESRAERSALAAVGCALDGTKVPWYLAIMRPSSPQRQPLIRHLAFLRLLGTSVQDVHPNLAALSSQPLAERPPRGIAAEALARWRLEHHEADDARVRGLVQDVVQHLRSQGRSVTLTSLRRALGRDAWRLGNLPQHPLTEELLVEQGLVGMVGGVSGENSHG